MMSLIVLHEAVERGSVGPGEDELIKHALELAYSYPSFNQQSGTYIELLSSGRLELISDEALRIALSKYDLSVQQSRFNETRISEHLIGTGSVDLIGRYRTYEPPKRNEDGEFRRSPVPAYDIVAMSADEEFRLQLNTIVENRGFLITNVYGQRVNIKDVMTAFEEAK